MKSNQISDARRWHVLNHKSYVAGLFYFQGNNRTVPDILLNKLLKYSCNFDPILLGHFAPFCWVILPPIVGLHLPPFVGSFYPFLLGQVYPILLGHFTPICWVIFTPFCWVIFTHLMKHYLAIFVKTCPFLRYFKYCRWQLY